MSLWMIVILGCVGQSLPDKNASGTLDEQLLQELLTHFPIGDDHKHFCNQIDTTLKVAGHEVTKSRSDSDSCVFTFDVIPRTATATAVFRSPGNKLSLVCGLKNQASSSWSMAHHMVFVNAWNSGKSFTKLIIDDDGDFRLELDSDLDLMKDVPESLPGLLAIFHVSVKALLSELTAEISKRMDL